MSLLDSIGQGVGIIADLFNVGEQSKNREYMKGAQEKTWEREDTAVQRRVKDLEAAGLSPTLAAGSAAQTSGPINVGVPQFSGANAMKAVEYGQARRQNAVTEANLDLIRTQTDAADANSFFARNARDLLRLDPPVKPGEKPLSYQVTRSMIDKMISDNKRAVLDNTVAGYNAAIAQSQGVPVTSGSLDAVGTGKLLENIVKNPAAGATPLAGLVKAFGLLLGGAK